MVVVVALVVVKKWLVLAVMVVNAYKHKSSQKMMGIEPLTTINVAKNAVMSKRRDNEVEGFTVKGDERHARTD